MMNPSYYHNRPTQLDTIRLIKQLKMKCERNTVRSFNFKATGKIILFMLDTPDHQTFFASGNITVND